MEAIQLIANPRYFPWSPTVEESCEEEWGKQNRKPMGVEAEGYETLSFIQHADEFAKQEAKWR